MDRVFISQLAAQKGTDLHRLANDLIRLKVKLPDNGTTMSLYVNDCIGFRMKSEVVLYYSANCFGSTDAIDFRDGVLRIADLKTGVTKTQERQLEIYAALFCLEYGVNPNDIAIELRIYQNDEVRIYDADGAVILYIMEKIRKFDERLNLLREEMT